MKLVVEASTPGDSQLALHLVDLGSLLTQHPPDRPCQWEELLSLEEMQRFQVARLLLRNPQLAVLDEPLASLPEEDALRLMAQIPSSTALLTFSRSRRLAPVHHRVLELTTLERWAPSIVDVERKMSASRPVRLGHKVKASE